MTKHIKGYLLWRGNDQDRKPVFIPNENGKYRLVYSDNGSLIISDWDLLHEKDSMDLEAKKHQDIKDVITHKEEVVDEIDDFEQYFNYKVLAYVFKKGLLKDDEKIPCKLNNSSHPYFLVSEDVNKLYLELQEDYRKLKETEKMLRGGKLEYIDPSFLDKYTSNGKPIKPQHLLDLYFDRMTEKEFDDLYKVEPLKSVEVNISCEPLKFGIQSSTSKMNEVKIRALGMIVNTSAEFNRSTITSIDMCVDKIDFMIQYNPCHINPKKHKKDYHEFWDAVKKELLAIRNIYQ